MPRPISVNVAAIARKAQVSTASVSRVLNNQSGVSETLRLKIRRILEQDGVYSNHAAERGVRVAVIIEVVEPLISGFTATLLSGIAEYALHHRVDVSTMFVASRDKAAFELLPALRERRCDGALLMFADTVPPEQLRQVVRARLAVCAMASRCDDDAVGFIDTDPAASMRMAVQHLWDLGHRRIAFLAGPCERIYDNSERSTTFVDALRGRGIDAAESWLIRHQPTVHAQEAGQLQAQAALRAHPDLTAIIANNDEMAVGAIHACHQQQRSVPGDVSVVGFDDYQSSRFTLPPLTTVRQHLQRIGHDAAKAIDDHTCQRIAEMPRRTLAPELILRDSTAPVRA